MLHNRKDQGTRLVPTSGHMRIWCVMRLLFDLDGTLVDPPSNRTIWAEWAARSFIECADILAISHGRRAEETMRLMAPHLKKP